MNGWYISIGSKKAISVNLYYLAQSAGELWSCKVIVIIWLLQVLTLWRPGGFADFWQKKHLNARDFAWELLLFGRSYRLGKGLKKRSKIALEKNFVLWGVSVVCEWRHKWRTFKPPWPTLPGPGRQPLGGSISLNFLLETRLQSESFDTLGNLLGFWVQKLWCKSVKIFD